MAQTVEQNEALENAGIPVIVTDAQDIEDVYEDIELLGKLTGMTDNASEVIENMKATFDGISHESESKKIYFEVSPLEYGLWTAGNGTFMNEIAQMLGLENIFADVEGWAEVSEEQVIDRDPDYIVTVTMYYGEGPTPTEEIEGRAGWQEMKAVVNGDVIQIDSDLFSVPGPRLAVAAQALFDAVYGD